MYRVSARRPSIYTIARSFPKAENKIQKQATNIKSANQNENDI
jgi:hypothetical protein